MEMNFVLVMDREIKKDKHYISPGGYEFVFPTGEHVQFDFCASYGYVNDEDEREIEFDLCDLDIDSFPEAIQLIKLLEQCDTSDVNIAEFYIYTGEPDESEINPIKVKDLMIYIDNKKYKFNDFMFGGGLV